MTHRIFYGIDFKLTDYDKKMFSRKGYECKDLLQGRAGLPVVVSQKQDKNFPNYRKIAGLNKSETDFSQNEKNHYPKTKILHSLCLCSRKRA